MVFYDEFEEMILERIDEPDKGKITKNVDDKDKKLTGIQAILDNNLKVDISSVKDGTINID